MSAITTLDRYIVDLEQLATEKVRASESDELVHLDIRRARDAQAAMANLAEVAEAAKKALAGHEDPVLRSLGCELAVAIAVAGGAA